jgi:hypothetical protein
MFASSKPSFGTAVAAQLLCECQVKPPAQLRVHPANFSFLKRPSPRETLGSRVRRSEKEKFAQQREAAAFISAKNRPAA